MNSEQIDSLLEQMKKRDCAQMDANAEEAICARLRHGIRRRRRVTNAICALLTVVLACSCFLYLHRKQEASEEICKRLELMQTLFPETGISLANGEIFTFEKQDNQPRTQHLGLKLTRINGKDPVTLDLIVGSEDYITLNEGPVTGELLITRCSDKDEAVIDFNLVFCQPNGQIQRIKDSVILYPIGVSCSIGSVPQDYQLSLTLDSISKG